MTGCKLAQVVIIYEVRVFLNDITINLNIPVIRLPANIVVSIGSLPAVQHTTFLDINRQTTHKTSRRSAKIDTRLRQRNLRISHRIPGANQKVPDLAGRQVASKLIQSSLLHNSNATRSKRTSRRCAVEEREIIAGIVPARSDYIGRVHRIRRSQNVKYLIGIRIEHHLVRRVVHRTDGNHFRHRSGP